MTARSRDIARAYWMWFALGFGGLVLFAFAPGGFAGKARLVLHGLCAQTPSHSFTLGGVMLPFDARMTGIYAGAGFTFAILAARGRLLKAGLPSWRVMILLASFVAVMAADGTNSLMTDLGLWHPWDSRNELRLVTGYATGITLAILLAWLISSVLWRLSSRCPVMDSPRDVWLCWAPFIPYAAVILSGAGWLYMPLSIMLMISAWSVLSILTLVMLLLALRWDDRVQNVPQLHVPGALAGGAGLAVMLLLAFGRVGLERVAGIPSTL